LYFVNNCRLADIAGVAVALDGAPLMRLFKRTDEAASPEELSIATRLQAVTNRRQAEIAGYPIRDVPTETPGPQRLFQVGELLEGGGRA
jgi:hypothetical protein